MKIDFIVDSEILTLSHVTFLIAIIEVSKHIKITPLQKCTGYPASITK